MSAGKEILQSVTGGRILARSTTYARGARARGGGSGSWKEDFPHPLTTQKCFMDAQTADRSARSSLLQRLIVTPAQDDRSLAQSSSAGRTLRSLAMAEQRAGMPPNFEVMKRRVLERSAAGPPPPSKRGRRLPDAPQAAAELNGDVRTD